MVKSTSSWNKQTQIQMGVTRPTNRWLGMRPFISEVGTAAALASELCSLNGLVYTKHLAQRWVQGVLNKWWLLFFKE